MLVKLLFRVLRQEGPYLRSDSEWHVLSRGQHWGLHLYCWRFCCFLLLFNQANLHLFVRFCEFEVEDRWIIIWHLDVRLLGCDLWLLGGKDLHVSGGITSFKLLFSKSIDVVVNQLSTSISWINTSIPLLLRRRYYSLLGRLLIRLLLNNMILEKANKWVDSFYHTVFQPCRINALHFVIVQWVTSYNLYFFDLPDHISAQGLVLSPLTQVIDHFAETHRQVRKVINCVCLTLCQPPSQF